MIKRLVKKNNRKIINKNILKHGNGQSGISTCVSHLFIYPC